MSREKREEIESDRERRNKIESTGREISMEEEREKHNKIIISHFAIVVCTISYLRWYYSNVAYFLRFGTSDKVLFLCLVCQIFGI